MKSAMDLVMQAKAQITEVTLEQAQSKISESDFLIDVREPQEFSQGHLPGAVNIPRGLLEFQIGDTPALSDRSKSLVLYCKSSGRAALSAQVLISMGYANVVSIAGGIDAWVAAGLPTAQPKLPDFN